MILSLYLEKMANETIAFQLSDQLIRIQCYLIPASPDVELGALIIGDDFVVI